jgi:hypothetical protein
MSIPSWLRSLQLALAPRRQRRPRVRKAGAKPSRPRLETLEDRTVPSTVTWVGGTTGDWDTAANWQDSNGVHRLPGARDDAVITTANTTVTHTSGASERVKSLTTGTTDTLNWSSGTLKIAQASSLSGAVNLSGGTWTGAGSVTFAGPVTWNGGASMTGTGSTTLASGATLSLGGDDTNETLDGRTFNNKGTVNWLNGSSILYLNDGAVFNNVGTFNANKPFGTSPVTQYVYDGAGPSGAFNNSGTFTNAAGAGNTTEFYNTLFNNTATVTASSGTLYLQGGGADSAGTFYVPSAGTLQFGGVTALASAVGSSTTKAAGTVAFSAGTTTVTGAITDTGNFAVAINGGTADFEKSASIPYLSLTNGTLTGSAAVTVTATSGTALTWNGGASMTGTGSTTLGSGATMSLGGDGTAETLDSRTFINKGTANWLAGSYILYLNDGAVFSNAGTFNANTPNGTSPATQYFYNGAGPSGAFNNPGKFTNAAGAGNTTEFYYTLFNNTGTVTVSSGTLYLQGGGTDSAGTFYVPSAGTLQFGGVTALASAVGSSTSQAAGTLAFSAGTTTVTGAINSTASFTVAINGGTADFEKAVSFPHLSLTSGTLTGSAAVTVTATSGTALTWNGGASMTGTGSTTLATGATMSLGGDGTAETLDGRTFNNQGTVNWLAASSILYLNDGAVFNNAGTFNANKPNGTSPATQYVYDGAGPSGAFNNSGTFTNAAGTGNTTEFYNTLFNNTATVTASSGTLYLQGGGTDSAGTFYVPSAGTLQFGGVTALASAVGSSTSQAAGTLAFTAGTTTVTGAINSTGNFTVAINGGTADFETPQSFPYLSLTSGTLTGSAAVTVTATSGTAVTW